jgi:NADH:ubiquinone oxidoreductase subunit 6 (subunit J)
MVFVLLQVDWPTEMSEVQPAMIQQLGIALVSPDQFVLVFEAASVLLLVALVGAVIIARER